MLTAERVHGFLSKSPGLSLEKVTVPVGVVGVPAAVSVTVAVQVVHWPTGTFLGSQSSDVAVKRRQPTRRSWRRWAGGWDLRHRSR
jgi:hypothetical protein